MRILGAAAALVGMSGCTVLALGVVAASSHHGPKHDDGDASIILDAMLADLTILGAIACVTHAPQGSASP